MLGRYGAAWARAAAAPDFTLTNLDGNTHSLAEYRGKIVVLNFWATWWLPCREEMPMLILDRDGTSTFRIEGEASKKDISSRLDWLLANRSGKQPKILIKNY
jgi:hypothetical protein